jgi:hypothetical protein
MDTYFQAFAAKQSINWTQIPEDVTRARPGALFLPSQVNKFGLASAAKAFHDAPVLSSIGG